MTEENYTFDDVKRVLHELAAEKPDYVYEKDRGETCTYSTKDGKPSCIIGHVIYRLDPEVFQNLVELENDGEAIGIGDLPWAYQFRDFEITAMERAQTRQDTGEPWGYAVKAFDEVLEKNS